MKRTILLMALLLAAAGASAQQYKWVDRNGRVQYGDTPPPGVSATPLRRPSGTAAPASAAPDAKAAPKSGALTPAEQEAEFRKRQEEGEKARQKQAKASEEAAAKKENCAVARSQLQTMESGQRIARTDAKGERYFLEDAQIAQEAARARQAVQQWCN
ncbi:MAG: DUF4124 domain-containing protein [Burkholderiales bacterium]